MSGEGKESVLPSLGGRASILRRKCASQPVSPRGRSTGRSAKNILGSVTPDPRLRNDVLQEAASVSKQQHGINQPSRADFPRPGGPHARTYAEDPTVNSPEGPSIPKSLVSVKPTPVVSVEEGHLGKYNLDEYVIASCVAPSETGQSSLLQLPLVANSDPKQSGRQSVLRKPIPTQKEGSLIVLESDTSSPPMPLMEDSCASSGDECTSSSVSFKSVSGDVKVFDFAPLSEREGDRRSMEATEYPMGGPRPITKDEKIEFDEALPPPLGPLAGVSPSLKPLDLGLSLDTNIEKEIVNDPDPSFHRAVGSPGGPVKEAFVEQVGSAFYINNLKNDSLGRLPQITVLERSPSEHEFPELIAIQESSPGGYSSRGSETFSSNSSNETIRPGARSVVILPGESDRRYHSNCRRRSHGEVDIGSAASRTFEGEGNISPPHARHWGVAVPEGPSRPPTSPEAPAATAPPEGAWVRAASEGFPFPGFSLPRKEKGSVVLERKPFPPGQGRSSPQGIHPALPIKTTVLCYANVLPEQPRVPTPILTVGDGDTGQQDNPSDSTGFSSVRCPPVSAASSVSRANDRAGGSEGSKSSRSVRALLLSEGIQLKEDDAGSGNGTPRDRLSRETGSLSTV
ncbi:hypothetical protein C7212DRAFT_340228 [Tuber magnatum]|uniref:Uncharacterized protein n=1 Tax=Tuber magnatum TaxID=42249 RepID=A0A317T1R9_9PEZI|nr:hypothetical protein C7212DRAFT_340228 [Tuber magnatum]